MAIDIGKYTSDLKEQISNIPGMTELVRDELGEPLPYKTIGLLDRKAQAPNPDNWNKNFRYSFQIVKAQSDGSVVFLRDGDIPDGFNKAMVSLRLPPQALSISTPFAMNVTATNRGILEESNGVIFRSITLQGTTGLYPDRLTVGQGQGKATGVAGLVKSIFPGVTTAISNVIKQANALKSSIVGDDSSRAMSPDQTSKFQLQNTGYYQFWVLHNFLIAYAEMKKRKLTNGKASEYRLLFNCPKDNISYVVTPVNFEMRRDRSEPMLYRYTIQLKAWDLAQGAISGDISDVLKGVPTPDNVGAIKSLTEVLRQTRRTIQSVSNVLKGVYSDVNSIFNVYNQGMLVLKDAVGVAEEISDFPNQIKNSADTLLKGPQNDFVAALKSYQQSSTSNVNVLSFDSVDEQESPNPGSQTQTSVSGAGGSSNQTTTSPSGETTPPPSSAFLTQAVGAFQQAVDDPEFSSQSLDQFSIPEEVQEEIDTAREEAIVNTTSSNIREMVAGLQAMSNNYAESVGMGDADYNAAFNLPPPIEIDRVPAEDDIINQAAIQEAALNWTATLATGQIFQERESDPFVFANKNLGNEDQVQSPLSATPVVFQRGQSLESMAQQFMGNANRAREIAILNNLRPPFIDEEGFERSISAANGRQFVVNSDENLAINQLIVLRGTAVAQTRRRIINLEDIGGQFRVTVDGPENLALYSPANNPYLFARIPGTVGPADIVLIPSEALPDDPMPNRPSALNERLTHSEKVFKIDLGLDDTGRDLAVSATGDIKRSYGYDNALQALRLAVETERGELEQHTQFGLGVPIGGRNSDLTADQIRESVNTTILNDPRFADAITEVTIDGSVSRIKIDAKGSAGTGQVAVEFEVGKE